MDKERSGMQLLRPLAEKLLKEQTVKDRVWSDELEAWGFYSPRREKIDNFLIWCNAKVGDRFALFSDAKVWMVCVILSIKKDLDPQRNVWKMTLLNPTASTMEFEIEESILYMSAWSTLDK